LLRSKTTTAALFCNCLLPITLIAASGATPKTVGIRSAVVSHGIPKGVWPTADDVNATHARIIGTPGFDTARVYVFLNLLNLIAHDVAKSHTARH
jgi:hypothetical protein